MLGLNLVKAEQYVRQYPWLRFCYKWRLRVDEEDSVLIKVSEGGSSSNLRPGTQKSVPVENDLLAITSELNQNLAHTIKDSSPLTFENINIVSVSHVICHVTILLKIVHNWRNGGGFKKRNWVITFLLFKLNISNTSRLEWPSIYCTSIKN